MVQEKREVELRKAGRGKRGRKVERERERERKREREMGKEGDTGVCKAVNEP